MSSAIQPFVQTTTTTVTSFSVSCQELNMFDSAKFRVDSFDENGNIVDRRIVPITQEQYLAWNNDDSYIVNLMASTLGYTLTAL